MRARSNEEWLSELQSSGEEQAIALEDLRAYLRRAAFYSLSQNAHALTRLTWTQIEQLAEDCAQEALLAGRLSADHPLPLFLATNDFTRRRPWGDEALPVSGHTTERARVSGTFGGRTCRRA